MKLTEDIINMIADIEYLIGSECYNPNSYDGWNDIEGCDFRYPISFPNDEGEYRKTRGKINDTFFTHYVSLTPETVPYMKYKFGSNELFIGKGIIKMLEYMEDRYNLDFEELEKSLKK